MAFLTRPFILTAAAAGLLFSTQASAVLGIPPGAKVEINLNGFSSGTLYMATPDTVCTTVEGCDTAAAGATPNPPLGPAPGGIGSEDTWGVANVNTMSNEDTLDVYYSAPTFGNNGQRIALMFYGVTDFNVTNDGINQTILSQGGFVEFWLYTATSGINASGGPTARTGLNTYPGVSDKAGAEMVLKLAFSPGVTASDPSATYLSNFVTTTFQGAGNAFMDVVDGTWADFFDTDSLGDPNGGMHDMYVDFTGNTTGGVPFGWTLKIEAQINSRAVPVPGTLLLLGAGLLGFSGARRRWSHA